jgi:opacity protein-like surface antigen
MRTLKIALLATVATAALSSATLAADLIIADPIVDNTYSAGFDWEGPYIGAFISGQTTPAVFGIGVDLGVNVLIDESLLAGVEGEVAYIGGAPDSWQGQVTGRLGFVADSALFYGFVGIGGNTVTDAYVPVGVGVEFGVADNVSINAEYQYQWDIDGATPNAHVGKVGLRFGF